MDEFFDDLSTEYAILKGLFLMSIGQRKGEYRRVGIFELPMHGLETLSMRSGATGLTYTRHNMLFRSMEHNIQLIWCRGLVAYWRSNYDKNKTLTNARDKCPPKTPRMRKTTPSNLQRTSLPHVISCNNFLFRGISAPTSLQLNIFLPFPLHSII